MFATVPLESIVCTGIGFILHFSIPAHPLKVGGCSVQNEVKERWLELCEQAANEQNVKKLLVLVKEINRLLEEKHKRLDQRDHRNPPAIPAGV